MSVGRVEPSVGGVVDEADAIDELIVGDGSDELNPSAFDAQPEAEEKDTWSDDVALCSLAARVQRKCARCPNSWLVDPIMDSVFTAKGGRRFYCSTVSEKCDRPPKRRVRPDTRERREVRGNHGRLSKAWHVREKHDSNKCLVIWIPNIRIRRHE